MFRQNLQLIDFVQIFYLPLVSFNTKNIYAAFHVFKAAEHWAKGEMLALAGGTDVKQMPCSRHPLTRAVLPECNLQFEYKRQNDRL